MNTENKKDMIVLPADFQFEKPTLTEFSYNKVASVQGASGGGSGTDADTNHITKWATQINEGNLSIF